ncbi:hypothetical protein FI667_g13499, partial [Globisporangium splendens]
MDVSLVETEVPRAPTRFLFANQCNTRKRLCSVETSGLQHPTVYKYYVVNQRVSKQCVRPRTSTATSASGGASGSSSTFFHNGADRSRQRVSQEFSRLFKQHKKPATFPAMWIPEEAVYAHSDMTVQSEKATSRAARIVEAVHPRPMPLDSQRPVWLLVADVERMTL